MLRGQGAVSKQLAFLQFVHLPIQVVPIFRQYLRDNHLERDGGIHQADFQLMLAKRFRIDYHGTSSNRCRNRQRSIAISSS